MFVFQRLHRGGFINEMLPLVEECFKSNSNDVKIYAYKAWAALIDNFALDRGTPILNICTG